jgi:hypothetical protein
MASWTMIAGDHDLSGVDRMRLCFDIDRDLITSMQLQATDGRRTHDAVDGNPIWQPTWYVAVDRTRETVTFEIAILARDLGAHDLGNLIPADRDDETHATWFIKAEALSANRMQDTQVIPTPTRWTRVVF